MKKIIYIKIVENHINMRCTKSGQSAERTGNFSSSRLAIGDFDLALHLIKSGLKELGAYPFYLLSPTIIMHQAHLEKPVLSQVEVRILNELGALAGGNPVHIWQGNHLTDDEILNKKHIK